MQEDNLYNLSFERSVLSSILFDPVTFEEISSLLKLEDFYLPSHASIYNAMMNLVATQKPIDEEFLKSELISSNAFDEQVILEIMSANPISNTKAYVDEIINKSKLRKLLGLTTTLKRMVLEEHHSSDQVVSAVDEELKNIVDINSDSNDFNMIRVGDIEDGKTDFILKDWLPIPKGTVTIVSAPGGTGKTWLAIQIALRHNRATSKKCAVWLSEDPSYESKDRTKAICEHILHIPFGGQEVYVVQRSPIQLMINKQFSYSDFYKFKKNFKDFDLIVLDPLIGFYGSDENDNSQARRFMQPIMDWAKETGKVIVFLHHSKKDGGTRGAGAFIDAARTAYEINKIDEETDSHEREITLTKDNYGVIKHLKSFKVRRVVTPKPPVVTEYTVVDNDSIEVSVI